MTTVSFAQPDGVPLYTHGPSSSSSGKSDKPAEKGSGAWGGCGKQRQAMAGRHRPRAPPTRGAHDPRHERTRGRKAEGDEAERGREYREGQQRGLDAGDRAAAKDLD